MQKYTQLKTELGAQPRAWVVTGVAGFIGSHLLETLLGLDQLVVGLDNFATGHRRNLDHVEGLVGAARWANFRFLEGDIRDVAACRQVCSGADYVLHEAALGSVPRSMADPTTSNAANIDGFLNMLVAAREANIKRFVFASSSSVYGDDANLPKVESRIGKPLSPYALTKLVDEQYAGVFAKGYGFKSVGLRYFNVFGPRQDPFGAYAAVIPAWTAALMRGEEVWINGDGETSRDFCYVANVVQANLLAALATDESAIDQVYNVGVGDRTTLTELFDALRVALGAHLDEPITRAPRYREFRPGDMRHSLANIDKARSLLGYEPTHRLADGLAEAMAWYVANLAALGA